MKILEYSTVLSLFWNASMTSWQMSGCETMGKMSMKLTPGLGKLGQVMAACLILFEMASSIPRYNYNSFLCIQAQSTILLLGCRSMQKQVIMDGMMRIDGREKCGLFQVAEVQYYNNNIITVMSHKYDTDSDQLKCNFCTQWFKTSLHYANLQRYSLKACHKCLHNFNYTILHPESYQIYKVFLFDLNFNIPPPPSPTEHSHHLVLELNSAKDELKTRIANQYQLKIRKLMDQMQKLSKRVEESARDIEANSLNKPTLKQSEKVNRVKAEILKKIDEFRNRAWDDFNQKQPKLIKNASSSILASIRNASKHPLKENQPANKGSVKSIRDRIHKPALLQSNHQPPMAKSRESHQLDSSAPKSLNKSTTFKSVKCLEQSRVWNPQPSFQESERADVQRLIQNYHLKETYLPFEETRDTFHINKCESKRTHADIILDLRSRTSKGGELIELIGANQTPKINFECFLESLGSQSSAKVVRIIKSGITDYDFDALLRFLSRHSGVQTLIVTNNRLTENAVQGLKNFMRRHPNNGLKRVYMGNNRILRERVGGVLREAIERGVEICL